MIKVGLYCGAKILRIRRRKNYGLYYDWKMYGLFRRMPGAFSIGPVIFWKEK